MYSRKQFTLGCLDKSEKPRFPENPYRGGRLEKADFLMYTDKQF